MLRLGYMGWRRQQLVLPCTQKSESQVLSALNGQSTVFFPFHLSMVKAFRAAKVKFSSISANNSWENRWESNSTVALEAQESGSVELRGTLQPLWGFTLRQ